MFEDRLRIANTAAYFDLRVVEERRRSVHALNTLFLDLQDFIRPKTFVEIGAFDAAFSRQIRERHPTADIIAFEANPHNHQYWSSVYDFPGLRIDYKHLAISDRIGTLEFLVQTKRGDERLPPVKGDDSLLPRAEAGIAYEAAKVDSLPLDVVLHDSQFATHDICLWIDVEGASKLVFSGATKSLERTTSIFIEVEERPYWSGQWLFNDIDAFLSSLGFRPIARDFENAHQFNVIFVRDMVMQHFMFMDRMVTYFTTIGMGARCS